MYAPKEWATLLKAVKTLNKVRLLRKNLVTFGLEPIRLLKALFHDFESPDSTVSCSEFTNVSRIITVGIPVNDLKY